MRFFMGTGMFRGRHIHKILTHKNVADCIAGKPAVSAVSSFSFQESLQFTLSALSRCFHVFVVGFSLFQTFTGEVRLSLVTVLVGDHVVW